MPGSLVNDQDGVIATDSILGYDSRLPHEKGRSNDCA
jgi:hypothetical protein